MDRSIGLRRRSARVGVLAAVAAVAVAAPGVLAQTPVAGDAAHPAHIHSGTCDALGDVVAPLTDVGAAVGEAMGPTTGPMLTESRTVVPLALDDIIAGGHAINVHLSADEIGEYIACGDIGGVVTTDEEGERNLVVGLRELNGSGHVGVAWLGDMGDRTAVAVSLIEPDGQE